MKTEKKLTTDDTEGTDGKGKDQGKLLQVPIDLIATDPDQPRKEFAPEKLQEMKESILQHGILQPMIVRTAKDWFIDPGTDHSTKEKKNCWYVLCRRLLRPDKGYAGAFTKPYHSEDEAKAALPQYELVAGERRLRGARLAGLKTVPVILRDLTESQIFAVQMVENLQRENLTALEEAAAMQRRVSNGARPDDLATELSISRATIFGRLALNRIRPLVRKALVDGRISTSVASLIALVPDPKKQEELLEKVAAGEYRTPRAFREVQEIIEDEYCVALKEAPFDLKDATLLPVVMNRAVDGTLGAAKTTETRMKGGACTDCPFRTGNMPDFPEGATRPNVCTQPECYHQKCKAHWVRKAGALAAKGKTVLDATQYKRTKGSYVEADKYEYFDKGGGGTWKEKLGKAAPEPVMAVTPKGLLPVYPRKEAEAALAKKGIQVHSNTRTKEDREKEEAKRKTKEALRIKRLELVRTQIETIAAALDKLPEGKAWEALESWNARNRWGDGLLFNKFKSAKARVLGAGLMEESPVSWEGGWQAKRVAVWKALGVDLIKLEKNGKEQMADGKGKDINAKTQGGKGAKGTKKGKK